MTISEEGNKNKKREFLMNFGRDYSSLNPFDEKKLGSLIMKQLEFWKIYVNVKLFWKNLL